MVSLGIPHTRVSTDQTSGYLPWTGSLEFPFSYAFDPTALAAVTLPSVTQRPCDFEVENIARNIGNKKEATADEGKKSGEDVWGKCGVSITRIVRRKCKSRKTIETSNREELRNSSE